MTLRYAMMFGAFAMAASIVTEDAAVLILAAMVWLGGAMGVRLRPSLAEAVSARRLPSGTEVAALAIGLIGAVMTLSSAAMLIELATALLRPRSVDMEAVLGPMFMAFAMGLPVGPAWHRIAVRCDAANLPLRPLATAFLGAGPLGLGLGVVWLSAVEPFVGSDVPSGAGLDAVMFAPLAVLLIAFGLISILPAFRGQLDADVVFRKTMSAVLVAWAMVAVVLALGSAWTEAAQWGAWTGTTGGRWSAAYAAATAIAWAWALWRIRKMPMPRTFAVVGAVLFLVFAFPISLWVSGALRHQGEWTDVIAIVLFPFALVTNAVIILGVPAVMGLLARDRQRPALAPSAGLS